MSFYVFLQFLVLYKKLKEMVTLGRTVFGSFIIYHYITTLSFIAELPHLILTGSEVVGRVAMAVYTVGMCCALGIASMAHTQVL